MRRPAWPSHAQSQNPPRNPLKPNPVAPIPTPSPAHLGSILKSADAVEFGVVEEMVAAHWRMRRSWCLETQLMDDCLAGPGAGDGLKLLATAIKNPDNAHALALLQRYEARHHNVYWRAVKNLLLLRDSHPPNQTTPVFGLDPVSEPAPAGDDAAPADAPNRPLPNEPSVRADRARPPVGASPITGGFGMPV